MKELPACLVEIPLFHLDIGCGAGVFINTLRRCSDSVRSTGIEPNTSYANVAAEFSGAENIYPLMLEDFKTSSTFDLITAYDTFEHVLDPSSFLKDALRLLSDRGYLVMEFPSFKCLSDLQPDHDILTMQHVFFFPYSYLHSLLNDHGLINYSITDYTSFRGIKKTRVVVKSS